MTERWSCSAHLPTSGTMRTSRGSERRSARPRGSSGVHSSTDGNPIGLAHVYSPAERRPVVRTRYALAVAVVVALSLGACDTTRHKSSPRPVGVQLATYAAQGVSFSYPAAWHSAVVTCPPALPPGTPYTIVYLSNQPLSARIGPGCDGPLVGGLKPRKWV